MKKCCCKIVFALLTLALCSSAYCSKVTITDDYYFINGFDFANYKAGDPSLNELVDEEIAVVEKDLSQHPEKELVIVGHSQGGPSALAFAKKWNDKYGNTKQIKAVITVSGIDKGLKALEGGFVPFKSKVTGKVNTLTRGVTGLRAAFPIITYNEANKALAAMNLPYLSNIDAVNNENIIKMIGSYCPDYIKQAWNGATYDEIPQLYDMIPNSDFLKENVCESIKRTYKIQSGTKTEWIWVNAGNTIFKYFTKIQIPVYTYVEAYQDYSKLTNEVKAGYIVGLDNNTFRMIQDFAPDGFGVSESVIRGYVATAADWYEKAEVMNNVKAVAGGITVYLAIMHGRYAEDCKQAKLMCLNIDSTVNDLLGSSEHDGLVAKESQYIPAYYVNRYSKELIPDHTNVLFNDITGAYELREYNHGSISPLLNSEINSLILNSLSKLK